MQIEYYTYESCEWVASSLSQFEFGKKPILICHENNYQQVGMLYKRLQSQSHVKLLQKNLPLQQY